VAEGSQIKQRALVALMRPA